MEMIALVPESVKIRAGYFIKYLFYYLIQGVRINWDVIQFTNIYQITEKG